LHHIFTYIFLVIKSVELLHLRLGMVMPRQKNCPSEIGFNTCVPKLPYSMAVLRPLAQATEAFFRRFGQETAENEIRWLRAAFDNPRSLLFVPKDAQKPEELDATLAQALKDRVEKHKPLQYIIGTQPFGGIEIKCRAPILIPRPETEWWVSKLAERFQPTLQRRLRILDLGTGTGCISLMLANHYPPGTVWAHGVDNNPQAVSSKKPLPPKNSSILIFWFFKFIGSPGSRKRERTGFFNFTGRRNDV
jgi:hypothetical protein